MIDSDPNHLVFARSSLAFSGSISLALLVSCPCVAQPAATPAKTPRANPINERNILLDRSDKQQPQYRLSTEKFESMSLFDRREGWYGGFALGVSSPNLSANGQIRGINVPFQLDIDTNKQTSLNAFIGRRFSNFRLEGEILSTNNSLKNGMMTFPSAPSLTNKISVGNVANFAVMFNGYYDFETGSAFKPFVGAGIGYSTTNLSIGSNPFPLNSSTSGFAYQVKVGAAYSVSDRTDLYLQYRYLNAPTAGQASGNFAGNNVTADLNTNLNSSIIEFGTRLNF